MNRRTLLTETNNIQSEPLSCTRVYYGIIQLPVMTVSIATDRDVKLMRQLRASNSATRGWRAIRKEMGLQGKLSARQLKKKWDNMKDKYRNPPEGMKTLTPPGSWRWFHLMDEAMSDRLAGTANIIQPSLLEEDEEHDAALPPLLLPNTEGAFSGLSAVTPRTSWSVPASSRVPVSCGEDEAAEAVMKSPPVMNEPASLYVTLLPDCTRETSATPSSCRNVVSEAAEVDRKLAELLTERRALEREQDELIFSLQSNDVFSLTRTSV